MPDPNLQLLEATARVLEPLLDEIVFVGGCVTGLLITDPAAAGMRPTTDVTMPAFLHPDEPSQARLQVLRQRLETVAGSR